MYKPRDKKQTLSKSISSEIYHNISDISKKIFKNNRLINIFKKQK